MNISGRNRMNPFRIMFMVALTLALTGCQQAETEGRESFINYCKSFQYISTQDEKKLEELRTLIGSGKVDPDNEVSFRTLSITVEDIPTWKAIHQLRIITYEVSAPGAESFHMRLPEVEIPIDDFFYISAPEYDPLNCLWLQKKTTYDFIKEGLSDEG